MRACVALPDAATSRQVKESEGAMQSKHHSRGLKALEREWGAVQISSLFLESKTCRKPRCRGAELRNRPSFSA
eukprot:3224807-Pyramimonas_sp.AAC.2